MSLEYKYGSEHIVYAPGGGTEAQQVQQGGLASSMAEAYVSEKEKRVDINELASAIASRIEQSLGKPWSSVAQCLANVYAGVAQEVGVDAAAEKAAEEFVSKLPSIIATSVKALVDNAVSTPEGLVAVTAVAACYWYKLDMKQCLQMFFTKLAGWKFNIKYKIVDGTVQLSTPNGTVEAATKMLQVETGKGIVSIPLSIAPLLVNELVSRFGQVVFIRTDSRIKPEYGFNGADMYIKFTAVQKLPSIKELRDKPPVVGVIFCATRSQKYYVLRHNYCWAPLNSGFGSHIGGFKSTRTYRFSSVTKCATDSEYWWIEGVPFVNIGACALPNCPPIYIGNAPFCSWYTDKYRQECIKNHYCKVNGCKAYTKSTIFNCGKITSPPQTQDTINMIIKTGDGAVVKLVQETVCKQASATPSTTTQTSTTELQEVMA